jgi:subtilisin family serine protease
MFAAGEAWSLDPNDPYFNSEQWPLKNITYTVDINVRPVWDVFTGNPNIKVGILDSLAAASHPDLSGRLISGAGAPANAGTMVAGIIGAKTNNGVGIAGVDWNSTLHSQFGARGRAFPWKGELSVAFLEVFANTHRSGLGIRGAVDRAGSSAFPARLVLEDLL